MTEKKLRDQTVKAFEICLDSDVRPDIQVLVQGHRWEDTKNTCWFLNQHYRIKPETKRILDDGTSFTPEMGEEYIALTCKEYNWNSDVGDCGLFDHGMVFKTKEGAIKRRRQIEAETKLKRIAREHFSEGRFCWRITKHGRWSTFLEDCLSPNDIVFMSYDKPNIEAYGFTDEDMKAYLWDGYVEVEDVQ